jgi:hypothetical protein
MNNDGQRRELWCSVFLWEHQKPYPQGTEPAVVAAGRADLAMIEFDKRFRDIITTQVTP